jgi:arylsulfatase A-like enzyme
MFSRSLPRVTFPLVKLFVWWVSALGLAGTAASVAAEPNKSLLASRPNILLIFADDQRADTIAAFGNTVIQTPHLDRLAKRGTTFHRAYMQGAMQGATCVPSRAMLLTGQNLFHVDERMLKTSTIPAAFAAAGYRTFMSGKWHNGEASLVRAFPTSRSVFLGGMTNPLDAKVRDVVAAQPQPPRRCEQHACAEFTDQVIRFLGEQKTEPFFAYLAFDGPHDPHIVPADYPLRYDPSKIPVPANFVPLHPFNNGDMELRDEQLLPWPRTVPEVQKMLAEYYRYVSYLDGQVGRVLQALEASPHARNTIVIFTADSGVARGSHGLIGKQNLYEHSIRVPLIVAGPGIGENQRSNSLCYLFDLLPTMAARCQVALQAPVDGIDFQETLADSQRPIRQQLVSAYRGVQRAVIEQRWKYIRYPQVDQEQLFDLEHDPAETKNLVADPQHAPTVARLRKVLRKELQNSGDRAPLEVDQPASPEWRPPARQPAQP